MPIIKNCLTCGKGFKTKPCIIKKGHGKYCSRKCIPPRSKETRKKIGEANKGKINSEETKRKISIAKKGKFTGPQSSRWKGGRMVAGGGYILILCLKHPLRDIRGYVLEHRLVMEKHLGRYLTKDEVVHHRGIKYPMNSMENRKDNRIQNLRLFASRGKHTSFHNLINF